uniref:AlNc14C81G5285 protein n=1 Tax=Albugo laibachii Nc14 TaxID=890382 RepID=F0WF93_9STRA|nr:AlNc14C81G5285 [Albugo laibachii Nc14]|eukprot:CCA19875.1 AlNc14C81G5285 [Albugo laibachii Nc14]
MHEQESLALYPPAKPDSVDAHDILADIVSKGGVSCTIRYSGSALSFRNQICQPNSAKESLLPRKSILMCLCSLCLYSRDAFRGLKSHIKCISAWSPILCDHAYYLTQEIQLHKLSGHYDTNYMSEILNFVCSTASE